MNKKIIPILLAVFLVTTACGFTIPRRAAPEPETTDKISVPVPSSGKARLTLAFGAGEMNLSAGAADSLVEGEATYNYSKIKPVVKTDGDSVRIQSGDGSFNAFPGVNNLVNRWDLKLGAAPTDLTIEAGAYTGNFELGGLALTGLTVKDGASTVDLNFGVPNKAEMSILRYETGASTVKMTGLGNANFNTLIFSGGAGDYTLDFSGDMQRPATATIEAGLCNVILVIPEGVHAAVTVESGAANVNAGTGWSQSGKVYTQEGEGSTLTVIVNIGAGNLTLTK
ncbi:MAG: toast rack family protein [Anaerolineales bacterium]|mgnify:FL=1|jgi:hypothetical protein|nr:toast rack family protein [Anaerolineales bacterium]MDX9938171.1 toast rack family protein [Anaerolineales bacterium]GER79037.1 conserved hypothetical protein [Candidatus Denitrolinea symbiosum]